MTIERCIVCGRPYITYCICGKPVCDDNDCGDICEAKCKREYCVFDKWWYEK